jgi:hypothetical protein
MKWFPVFPVFGGFRFGAIHDETDHGQRQMELGGKYLDLLRDSTDARCDFAELRARLHKDGYLRIRGLHKREKVKAARRVILENLAANGPIDTSRPLDEGVILPGKSGAFKGGDKALTHTPEFLALVEAPELMEWFSNFLDAPALT